MPVHRLRRNWLCCCTGHPWKVCGVPEHMLARQLRFLRPQVIPVLVQLIGCTSGSRFRNSSAAGFEGMHDAGGRVVMLQRFRDAPAKVENTGFHEGERGRNGLRHGLRLQAVAVNWSKTNALAGAMVPGGGIEPPTRGFSIHCSTPELPGHGMRWTVSRRWVKAF